MMLFLPIAVLGFTLAFGFLAWCSHPRLWLPSLSVLLTAAAILLYVPVRIAFWSPTASYDPGWDGYTMYGEFVLVASTIGALHLGLLIILIRCVVVERRRLAEENRRNP